MTMDDEKTKQKAIEAVADLYGVDSIAADLKEQKLTHRRPTAFPGPSYSREISRLSFPEINRDNKPGPLPRI
ncbi:hypothetical protein D8674_028951 [Pyrus ussuriensis x Pyrus communis]|uniref:Uncharacterized protein n=1 Tax=Pyrus ussuriensis x Pyrus communis TaxID=2448454 RepID=A0A5N5IB78_9ROSA|nr:hypothetical protein D8674_028951 [Pyrus ussuriensis x Pyrus communis]